MLTVDIFHDWTMNNTIPMSKCSTVGDSQQGSITAHNTDWKRN